VHVRTLWLTDFRSYTSIEVNLSPGLTVLVGANGEGKTNLLEALAWLATLASFRGAPTDALVRRGASFAVVRALAERDGRELLLEAQLQATGRNRVLVNRQSLRGTCSGRYGSPSSRPTIWTSSKMDRGSGGASSMTRWWRCTPATTP
jgi:DNA replication and repair protein RecF